MKTVNTFLIGADPEYIALDKNGVHVNVKAYTTKEAQVAWDHEGDVLEVKPEPSKYAWRLVRRIRKLLLQHEVSKQLIDKGYKFRGGGYFKTVTRSLGLGGHIHFDFPYSTCTEVKIHALHNLTWALEELDILPKMESYYRHTYSNIDAIRTANSSDRFEYRFMCSWLHSPTAALLCLTAAKLVAANPSFGLKRGQTVASLQSWFEQFKEKDIDAARVVEKIFEPKLKIEAELDVDLQKSWKSLNKLGGIKGHAVKAAL